MPANLLFIYTDEQAVNTLAAYGNRQIQMPNLDRLAAAGTVFEQAYVTQPVCTPSRSSLLTGLWPHQNGCTANNIPLPQDVACLPEMLQSDYITAHYGKWHLGDEIFAQHGFQEWRSIEDLYRAYYSDPDSCDERSHYHKWLVNHGVTPENGSFFRRGETCRLPEHLGKPAYLAGEACDFLQRHRDDPFILYVNFLEPHMPYYGPRDDQYDPASIPLPANFESRPGNDVPLKLRVYQEAYRERGHSGFPLRTPEDWRRMIARYWGLCSLVDTHAGRILTTLEELGLDRHTVVVFTSDHGDMMGSHQLLAKCVMYEEAVRVPLIVRLPGQEEGRRIQGPVSQIDLVPTLLELLRQPVPENLPGKSRAEWLQPGGPARVDDGVVIEWQGPNSGAVGEGRNAFRIPERLRGIVRAEDLAASVTDPVRTLLAPDQWKFSVSSLGRHELYNLATDPFETRNLARAPDQRERMAALFADLRRWQQRTGDTVALADGLQPGRQAT